MADCQIMQELEEIVDEIEKDFKNFEILKLEGLFKRFENKKLQYHEDPSYNLYGSQLFLRYTYNRYKLGYLHTLDKLDSDIIRLLEQKILTTEDLLESTGVVNPASYPIGLFNMQLLSEFGSLKTEGCKATGPYLENVNNILDQLVKSVKKFQKRGFNNWRGALKYNSKPLISLFYEPSYLKSGEFTSECLGEALSSVDITELLLTREDAFDEAIKNTTDMTKKNEYETIKKIGDFILDLCYDGLSKGKLNFVDFPSMVSYR
jgi:hypothetical protein